jgi:hypothetical protein
MPVSPVQATGREVPIRIKYSGRQTMASTATGFGEVHAQEQVRGRERRGGRVQAEGWMPMCVWRAGLWLALAETSVLVLLPLAALFSFPSFLHSHPCRAT